MHIYAPENLQHIYRTPPFRENLNYEKFLFAVVKRNLLAIKMDKKTNKK